MSEVAGDERIFIRSMASRGALGGVALASSDAADILDAWGCDRIVIETVGVGQSEIEIVRATDTTLVVLTPESGDEVQAAKAGLMEIADAFVINKSDRPGSDTLFAAMRAMLDQRQYDRDPKDWAAPLLRTVATNGAGINELVRAIDVHRDGAKANGGYQQRRERNRQQRVVGLVNAALAKDYWSLANTKRLAQFLSTAASVPSAREIAARLLAKARDER
jgi:LAO/AO transport system kinase